MTHPENLIAWLDNELPPEEAGCVGRHVEACPECRAELRTYAALSESLAALQRARRPLQLLAALPVAAAIALLLVTQRPASPPAYAAPPTVARVTIPADAVLPPGLLPQGTQIVADIAPDGSATAVDLLP